MSTYYWKCQNCGTTLQLRQRITLKKRICPQCGNSITPEDIDRETTRRERMDQAQNARREQVRKTLKEISDRLNFGK